MKENYDCWLLIKMKPIKPRDLMNYLKNNRRIDQDALIEYILSALSDGEFIYGPEESSLVMESSPPSPKHYPYDSSSCGSVLYITMVLETGIPITTLPEYYRFIIPSYYQLCLWTAGHDGSIKSIDLVQ